MGIALIIVGGLVLMTLFASGFDFLTKKRKGLNEESKNKILELEKKVANLEAAVTERNDRLAQLEDDVSFMTKLLEEKK
jgi:SMC interacting uncharacterized protein involved in chromosome segregation